MIRFWFSLGVQGFPAGSDWEGKETLRSNPYRHSGMPKCGCVLAYPESMKQVKIVEK